MKKKPKPIRRVRRSRGCPVEGCVARIPKNDLMCRRHWARVPRELRERQIGLVRDFMLAFDQEARDFIMANLAMNQVLCKNAAQHSG